MRHTCTLNISYLNKYCIYNTYLWPISLLRRVKTVYKNVEKWIENAEKRRARLDRQKEYCQKRKSSQTEQQRAARLAQLSSCQWQRIATETEEQRAARLAQLTSCQQQRLSTETEEQRAARLAERILS